MVLLLHVAACLPDPLPVRPRTEVALDEQVKAVNYPVNGSTWSTLMQSVDDQAEVFGVAGHGERTLHGRAVWRLKWHQHLTRKGFDCLLTVELSIEVVTMLPEWTPPSGTDPALIGRWDAWLDRLRAHEAGHEAIAVQVARELRDAAEALVPDPSCVSLGKELNRLGSTSLDRANANQKAYDTLTDHGAHQERWEGLSPPRGAAP